MSELDGSKIPQKQPVRTEEGEDLTQEVNAAVSALDTASYVRELDDLVEGQLSLQQTSAALLRDKQPQETVRRMMEILIQKDEKWLKEEAWNDTRFLFFHYAL